ncbi:MAG: ComF family protein [Oscillospiraceae bacterium]|nr:ComF family protein [Oscillospiraceae bacterium]MBR7084962.1 ComF family protein [Oscillospiraceae bacterium]
MHQMTQKILNFFYPNFCPKCGVFLLPEELLCDSCAEKILLEQDGYCHQCGKETCICKYQTFAYDKAVVACRYDKETAPAVISLKMSKNTNFAYFSARILAERLKHGSYYQLQNISCVMPVPMHISKQRKRGYNQAALIAKELADLLHLPYREDVLFKERSNIAQHTLSAEARMQNVKSFGIRDISLKYQCILLCDDVLTTGSTMNRCAELLKSQQASAVIAAAASSTAAKSQNLKEEKFL